MNRAERVVKDFFLSDREKYDIDLSEIAHFSKGRYADHLEEATGILFPNSEKYARSAPSDVEKGNVRKSNFKERTTNRYPSFTESDLVSEYEDQNIPLHVYKKMSNHARISLGMLLIKGMATSLTWKVKSSDPQVTAVVEHSLKKIMSTLVREMIEFSYRYGWFMAEKVWQREEVDLKSYGDDGMPSTIFKGSVFVPKNIKGLDPLFNFNYYRHKSEDDIKYIEQYTSLSPEPIKLTREKIFWFPLDKEFGNIFGRPKFRSAYGPYYNADLTKQYMVSNIATAGTPPIIGWYPNGHMYIEDSGQSVPNDEILSDVIRDLLIGGVGLLPSERDDESGERLWGIELAQNNVSDLGKYEDVFNYFTSLCLEAIGIPEGLIHGDNNASELDAKVNLFFKMFEPTLDQLEGYITKELVDWIVVYNFGPDKLNDYEFKFDRNGLGRTSLLKEILVNMLRISTREGAQPKVLPSIMGLCRDLDIDVSGYKEIYMEDPYMVDPMGGAPSAATKESNKQKRAEDQNNGGRLNDSPRNRERPSKSAAQT